jgi:glucosamine-phosphate N-acetyltransferase
MNQQGQKPSDFQIRKCCAGGFKTLLQLFRELWPDKPIRPATLRKTYNRGLTRESQAYISVIDKARVVGFGSLTIKNSLWQEGTVGHIDELIVRHEYRGRGIGTQLLSCLEALAKERKCRRVELDSAHHRKEAHRFYEQRGFHNRAFLFSKVL